MPSPLTSTTFSKLIIKLLKTLDSYNSQDLSRSTPTTDSNTSGEIAGICINYALHTCYDEIKDSKYLEAYPTTALISTANQDYIELEGLTDADEFEAILDTGNNIKLQEKTWYFYRKNYPDPSKVTGVPLIYVRRNNRIYLAPRPTSAIQYTADFVKLTNDLTDDADVPLLPEHYDYWIIAEAMVWWGKMENPGEIPPIFISDRDDARNKAVNAIMSGYDMDLEAESHWNEGRIGYRDYQRPVGG